MKKVIKYLFLYRVVMLFLTWYGKVMVWIIPMYYKSLRSRIMFEKSLWKENLNLVKIQKKFYCKKEIWIKSKSKEELEKIDLQKEIEKLNIKPDINFILDHIEYFKEFNGFVIIFGFTVLYKKDNKKKNILGIFFYNYDNFSIFNIDKVFLMYLLYNNDVINNTILALNLYFEDYKRKKKNLINKKTWINIFDNFFFRIINRIPDFDKNISIKFLKFKNLNDILDFLKENSKD